MDRKARVIVIDPFIRKVYEDEIDIKDGSGLEGIQALVKNIICIAMEFVNRDAIMVDDEGIINGTEDFFLVKGAHQPFAGIGVLVGTTSTGATTSCRTKLIEIVQKVAFMNRAEASLWAKQNSEENQ